MENINAYLYILQMGECVHVLVTFRNDSHSWDVTGVHKKKNFEIKWPCTFPHSSLLGKNIVAQGHQGETLPKTELISDSSLL